MIHTVRGTYVSLFQVPGTVVLYHRQKHPPSTAGFHVIITTDLSPSSPDKKMSPEHSARDKEERSVDDRTRFWQLIVRETRAVSLWTLMSISLRGILLVLGMLSMYIEDSSVVRWGPLERWEESWRLWKDRLNTPLNTPWLLLARWILMLLPSKVPSFQAPGFMFANPW
jgi:hypothetical protein